MEDLKRRATVIVQRAKYHVSKHKTAALTGNMYETGLQRYPEFTPLVNKLVKLVVREINAEAKKIKSEMPYKAQFVLEEVIRELKERV